MSGALLAELLSAVPPLQSLSAGSVHSVAAVWRNLCTQQRLLKGSAAVGFRGNRLAHTHKSMSQQQSACASNDTAWLRAVACLLLHAEPSQH